jgi:hypothetical protein
VRVRDENDAQPARDRRPLVVAKLVMVVFAVVLATFAIADDDPTRQEIVSERGASVMPFDLDATTHVFDVTDFGGIQTVVADDPSDAAQIELIRAHLRGETERFRAGDFDDPAAIHGDHMPGLATLEANAGAVEVSYRETSDGAQIKYRATDPDLVSALHDWFAAQTSDHGDHAATAYAR